MSDVEHPGPEETAGRETPPEPEPEAPTISSSPPQEPAPIAGPRKLRRSRDDRVIAGVCGGLGEYLGVDAVIIRIAALVLLFAGGAGLVAYLIGWLVIPEAPPGTKAVTPVAGEPHQAERTNGAVALGVVFVLLGAFFLLDHAFPHFLAWEWVWPIALILLGVIVLARARR